MPEVTSAPENPFDPGYVSSEYLSTLGFRAVGRNVKIARNSTIIGIGNISIGDNVRIDGNVTIVAPTGHLTLGSYIHIGGGCHMNCSAGLTMEDFSCLSQGVRVYTGSDDYSGRAMTNSMIPSKYLNTQSAPVHLGKHVVIGSGSVVLPGVTAELGSAVGALSLVNKSLVAWGIYAGVPARRIKERSKDLLELEQKLLADAQQ